MFNNNFMGGSRSYPMLNPPAFMSPYPAPPPLGMGTGGYLPQQPSPVAPQQLPELGQQTLGMANGGYLPQQAQQMQQQNPSADILSMLQAYMAQQQPNQRPGSAPTMRPTFPSRTNPSQMGLGSLVSGSRMPQMPIMAGFGLSRPNI